jgi:hypothetical protein
MCAHQVRSYGPSVTTNDRTNDASVGGHTGIPQYEIRVKGHLAPRWTVWFDGLRLDAEDDGTTVIRGPVVDQAALHGVLQRLRDVGIPLVSLRELPTDASTAPIAPRIPEGN